MPVIKIGGQDENKDPGIQIGGENENNDPNYKTPEQLAAEANKTEAAQKAVNAAFQTSTPMNTAVEKESVVKRAGKAIVRAGKKLIEMLPIVLDASRDLFEAFKQMGRGASWSATFAQLNGKPWVKSIMNGPVGWVVHKIFQEDPKLKDNVKGFAKEQQDNDNSQQQSVGETTNNISKASNKNNFSDRLSKVTDSFKSMVSSGTANNKVDKSPVVFSNLLDPNLGNNNPEPKPTKTFLDKIKDTVIENKNSKYKKPK